MVSTSNAINNDQITKEHIAMFQTLKTQMEEMCQNCIEDQRRNEEEVILLKEQNKDLKQQLDGFDQGEQS